MKPRPDHVFARGYDVIGDVHGEAEKLRSLLIAMGYRQKDGAWIHPVRKAVFVGDYIDRGPDQVGVYRIVRGMIEAGSAYAIMGNHELNAIAYATPEGNGGWCREHSADNRHGHAEFLDQAEEGSRLYHEIIDWMKTLPLWLDLGDIRVVHACWDEEAMRDIAPYLDRRNALLPEYIPQAAGIGSTGKCFIRRDGSIDTGLHPLYRSIETLLKGVEVELPEGVSYHAEGKERHATRVGWWSLPNTTYDEAAVFSRRQRAELREPLPSTPLPARAIKKQADDRPLFIGHYWREASDPAMLAPNIACVDFSACRGGQLVAYRWSGEKHLTASNLTAKQQTRKVI